MIKRLGLAVALFVFAGVASAASFSTAAIGGGASKTGSTWAVSGPSASAANGAFYTPASVTAAGQAVTMPASASFAANAASFAIGAVRLNPAGLITTAVASWLLQEGLQWANNSWTKTVQLAPLYSVDGRAQSSSLQTACLNRYSGGTITLVPGNRAQCWNSAHNFYYLADASCTSGPVAAWGADGYATCSATVQRAAIEDDFTQAGTHPITSPAAQSLAQNNVPIPVNVPVITPQTAVPIGQPYLDPVSGRQVQRYVDVMPSPTAANPLQVQQVEYVKDAGAVPGQNTALPAAPTSEIVFPSDYARQGEADAAAKKITDKLDEKLGEGANPVDPLQPDEAGFNNVFFNGTFTNLTGWQLPAHTSTCPSGSFDFNGALYSINSHCQLIADHFGALQAVMTVVWTVLALFIVLGA